MHEQDHDRLRDLRVLVVEDDFLVAEAMRTMLTELGCRVVGPAYHLADAMARMDDSEIDAALLDIQLHEDSAVPVARAIVARERPVLFVTGYSSPEMLPEDLRDRPRLQKPVTRDRLAAAMHQLDLTGTARHVAGEGAGTQTPI